MVWREMTPYFSRLAVQSLGPTINCMRSQAAAAEVDPYDPYTPGQAAAIQWVSILMLTTNMDSEIFEDIKPHIPNFYNRLIQLH